MTPSNIDDGIVQQIYDKITELTDRSFARYERPRSLPRTKIPGDLVFVLDALLDLASGKLKRDESGVLAELIDLGIIAWFAGLSKADQAKCGLEFLAENDAVDPKDPPADSTGQANQPAAGEDSQSAVLKALEIEREKNRQLEVEVAQLKVELQENIAVHKQLNDEIEALKPLAQAHTNQMIFDPMPQPAGVEKVIPAFLSSVDDTSTYTPLTTHTLQDTLPKESSNGKKNNKKFKR
ncbi:MAG: hypothetical protein QNJ97_20000 [Myxococcota bacterium]|nr:hypothetical protein [Myxococcota bacterium]